MSDVSHIASLVVRTRPEDLQSTSEIMDSMDGVEIHAKGEAGKLVVVIEEPDSMTLTARIREIESIPTVLNAVLVYHHVDEPGNQVETIVNASINEEKSLSC